MKEATGELNMTLITIIAIVAVGALFTFLLPTIRNTITNRWNDADNAGNNMQNAINNG